MNLQITLYRYAKDRNSVYLECMYVLFSVTSEPSERMKTKFSGGCISHESAREVTGCYWRWLISAVACTGRLTGF